MRVGSIVSVVVALALGGLAAYLAKGVMVPGKTQVASHKTAVVAAQPLAFGIPLTSDNLREIPWPSDSIPEGAFTSIKELLKEGRRVTLSSFQRNEPILKAKITGPNQRATLSTIIEEGMRAVTVRVDEVRGVAGFILPGDRVDLILTRGESGSENAAADVLIQNTKVLAIDQKADDRQEKPTVVNAVTLELDMQQAQKVILAQGIGRLSLVLRQAGEANATPTRRVLASELTGGEVAKSKPSAEDERIAKLEARLEQEMKRSGQPQPPVVQQQPLVNVIRNATKREQYTVQSER